MSLPASLVEEGVVLWHGREVGIAFRGYGFTHIQMRRPLVWLPEGYRLFPTPVWDWVSRFCELETKFS